MSSHATQYEVVHNEARHRFEIRLDATQIAIVDYVLLPQENTIAYTHTGVPQAYEGQGVGAALARHVLDYARDNGLRVEAACPYIHAYVRRHEEYQPITRGFGNAR
jgi:hypothetical protein